MQVTGYRCTFFRMSGHLHWSYTALLQSTIVYAVAILYSGLHFMIRVHELSWVWAEFYIILKDVTNSWQVFARPEYSLCTLLSALGISLASHVPSFWCCHHLRLLYVCSVLVLVRTLVWLLHCINQIVCVFFKKAARHFIWRPVFSFTDVSWHFLPCPSEPTRLMSAARPMGAERGGEQAADCTPV